MTMEFVLCLLLVFMFVFVSNRCSLLVSFRVCLWCLLMVMCACGCQFVKGCRVCTCQCLCLLTVVCVYDCYSHLTH